MVYNKNVPIPEHADSPENKPRTLYDICIDAGKGRLEMDSRNRGVTQGQAVVTVPLLAGRYRNDDALSNGVHNILRRVPILQPNEDGWVNCLGWALEGAKALHGATLISQESLNTFRGYITPELQKEVAKLRDAHTIEMCGIEPGDAYPSRVVTRELRNRLCSSTSRTHRAPAKKRKQGKIPQMQKFRKQARNSKGRNVAPPKQPRSMPRTRGK
ncbi:hypothetical protein HYPSUDRAFT_72244 [Hypholoma sublateritium FD-334 SS-4]|uniref:Uncharacterized protein n=1 Tax=Hypholoma sublateritium (strain FD-334 SS-4) TaxID=945553 RepID=A0A0D2LWC5_HYPSF|nr:hypothetical protein HYPSUDRAFT_72244 [Hypholoma sublateritium FD-334 SS-4]